MRIAFRVDASAWIGSGHVVRCLTLADALRSRGAESFFICRDFPGHLGGWIAERGHTVLKLPVRDVGNCETPRCHADWLGADQNRDAAETLQALAGEERLDWLVVDHYGIDKRWEDRLVARVGAVAVIDDLADRPHTCDLLLDQNLYCNLNDRYGGLLPAGCRTLLGPKFALLRPEFAKARERMQGHRDGRVKRILVFFGGYDASNETEKALKALAAPRFAEIAVDVVVGAGNPYRDRIEKQCRDLPGARFFCQVTNMAELMAGADLSLGAGGATSWERFSVGLPSLIVAVADNQERLSSDLGTLGLAVYLGRSEQVDTSLLEEELEGMLDNPERLLAMQEATLRIVDGLGAERAVEVMFQIAGRTSNMSR